VRRDVDSEENATAAIAKLTPANGPAVISAGVHAIEADI
jgi:hypothetical protein